MRSRTFTALALAAVLAGGTAVALAPIDADAQAQHQFSRTAFTPGRHVEGRIAYLKAELKITDAQAPLWNKVADTMRDNAKQLDDAMSAMPHDPNAPRPTAIERLETHAKFAEMRAQGTERFLAAFRPLYNSLSDDQKKNADDMMGGHHHHHRHA